MENLTKNNSNEMNTIVETFLVQETVELIYDNDKLEQWNKQIEELGLTGQKNIVKTDKSPIPFMPMNNSLINIFQELLPKKENITEYQKSPIPVEILELALLSHREGYFDKIQIWSDVKSPDPACIGLKYRSESDRANGYSWNMDHYLIGKWADVRRSFEELKSMAITRYKTRKTYELTKKIKDAQRELEDLDNSAFEDMGQHSELPF